MRVAVASEVGTQVVDGDEENIGPNDGRRFLSLDACRPESRKTHANYRRHDGLPSNHARVSRSQGVRPTVERHSAIATGQVKQRNSSRWSRRPSGGIHRVHGTKGRSVAWGPLHGGLSIVRRMPSNRDRPRGRTSTRRRSLANLGWHVESMRVGEFWLGRLAHDWSGSMLAIAVCRHTV